MFPFLRKLMTVFDVMDMEAISLKCLDNHFGF